jgi:hypothetical protein
MATIMKLAPAVLLSALGSSACFEEPLPNVDPSADDSSTTGVTSAPPGTTGPDPSTTGTTTAVDETTTTTATTSSTSTGLDESTGVPPLECVDGVLEPSLGAELVEVPTAPGGDDFTGSCGGAGSADVAYEWDVPYSDFFVIDTEGSDFDTLLYLLDDCGGDELACNDNAEDSVSSRVVAPFERGERLVVVVDGNAGESGTAVLNIEPVSCPSADLIGQALPAGFSNVAGANDHGGVCGGGGNPERAFRWQAEQAGLYAFIVDSDEFPPTVYLEEGPICGGLELGCNPAAYGHSEVIRALAAGQYVTVYADSQGGAGDFDIDIVELEDPCPAADLMDFTSGEIGDFTNVMSSSCGPSGYEESGTFYPFVDATFSWTSPGMIGSNSGCEITVVAGFPVALSLQAGTCDGPEVECVQGTFDEMVGVYEATVSVGHIPPTDFTVAVSPMAEPFTWIGGAGFLIEVACFAVA